MLVLLVQPVLALPPILAVEAEGSAIAHDAVLLLLLQLALLLAVARALGLWFARRGVPSVVGEILAGFVLGPTLFGAVAPGLREAVFPAEPAQQHLLGVVSLLGVMLLLLLTGLETDLKLIFARRRIAGMVSLGGIIVPFTLGVGAAVVIPDRLVGPIDLTTFALFIGTAMSISAIPVIAKVLIELGVIRRDIGQLTLAAGMIDDTIGWILLSVVAGLARSGTLTAGAVAGSVLSVAGFLLGAFTLGRWLLGAMVRRVATTFPGRGPLLTLVVMMALLFAAVTQWLEIEAALGAFVLGILAGQIRRIDHHLVNVLEMTTLTIFAPIFFASAGLQVDLGALLEPTVALVGAFVLSAAIGGKFIGAYLGAKAAGLSALEGLTLGAGMNARGALEIIVATIGLSLGVLTQEMFTIIVMVAIVTSLMAPPILRSLLHRLPMSPEEQARLEREAGERTSLLANVHRILIPTRGGTNSQLAAQLLHRITEGRHDVEVTVMHVGDPEDAAGREAVDRVVAQLPKRHVVRRLVAGPVDEAILGVARSGGYDLIVIGATETSGGDLNAPLFSHAVDNVLLRAPCPVLIIHARFMDDPEEVLPAHALARILVPTRGGDPQRRAPELAFAIARADDVLVDVVQIAEPPAEGIGHHAAGEPLVAVAAEIAAAAAGPGLQAGCNVHASGHVSPEPFGVVVAGLAASSGADLIVLRDEVQPVTRRVHLSSGAEHVLRHAKCPVVVLTGE